MVGERGKKRKASYRGWLIALALVAIALVALWSTLEIGGAWKQTTIPSFAKPEFIERRYARQIARMHQYVKCPGHPSWRTVAGFKADRQLFSPSEILEAEALNYTRQAGRSWKSLDGAPITVWFHRRPTVGRPIVNVGTVPLANGSSLKVAIYEAVVLDALGEERGCKLVLRLDKLEVLFEEGE